MSQTNLQYEQSRINELEGELNKSAKANKIGGANPPRQRGPKKPRPPKVKGRNDLGHPPGTKEQMVTPQTSVHFHGTAIPR
jgi:hypothetical protein